MEPDSNDRIPNFFLDNDKNTKDLNRGKVTKQIRLNLHQKHMLNHPN